MLQEKIKNFLSLMMLQESFFIKANYTPRIPPEYVDDVLSDTQVITHQPDVYPFVAYLGERFGCTHVIDVGCDSAKNLTPLSSRFQIVGIDYGTNLQLTRNRCSNGTWLEWDLENPGRIPVQEEILSHAIIVCSDAIEHIVNPSYLLDNLRAWLDKAPICILSTPERDLVRGPNDTGPPANPAHVREWSMQELETLLRSKRLNTTFIGLTANNDRDREKKTIIAVIENNSTATSRTAHAPSDFTVVAIMTAYNEEDIIVPSLTHLINEGVGVYLIDNWSSDATYRLAQQFAGKGLVGIERFPAKGPRRYYNWRALLNHVAELCTSLEADWFMHHDVDEVRVSPWTGVNLRDALYRVDSAGFNCIDHTVLEFQPVDNSFAPGSDFSGHFKHFKFGARPGHFAQIKAWKNLGQKMVSLADSGGHKAIFEGCRVYPYKFLLKHYPIRSQAHGEKKLFTDRKPRWHPDERAKGWHTHYDHIKTGQVFVHDPSTLLSYDESSFNETYLVERLSGVGIVPQTTSP